MRVEKILSAHHTPTPPQERLPAEALVPSLYMMQDPRPDPRTSGEGNREIRFVGSDFVSGCSKRRHQLLGSATIIERIGEG